MCDHTYCYTPPVLRMQALVAEGEVGDVQYVDSVRINLGLVQRDVDVMWDLAPHDLSILDVVLPPDQQPIAVSAVGADPVGAGRACVAYLTMPLAGGGIAHLHVNWLSPTKVRTTIVGGSRRIVLWDDLEPTRRLSLYDRGVDVEAAIGLGSTDRDRSEQARISYRLGDMTAPALPESEPLASVVEELAAAIRDGRAPRTDAWAGVRVLTVLDAASRSLAEGGGLVPFELPRPRQAELSGTGSPS
jgi:predicted dehydrogenase